MNLIPYLFFTGNCAEAMEFYKSVFGGELNIMLMGDGPAVMHAVLKADDLHIFGSDGTRTEPYETSSITLSLNGGPSDRERILDVFAKLCDGGKDVVGPKIEDWGDEFGSVSDKYGTDWLFNIATN